METNTKEKIDPYYLIIKYKGNSFFIYVPWIIFGINKFLKKRNFLHDVRVKFYKALTDEARPIFDELLQAVSLIAIADMNI